jgi:hypothetical protein
MKLLNAADLPYHFIQTRGVRETYETIEGQHSSKLAKTACPSIPCKIFPLTNPPDVVLTWKG